MRKALLYHVDDNTIQQIKKYFEKDLDVDGVYEKVVLKIDRIKGGLFTNSDTEVGTPPNMRVSFVKGNVRTICDMDEFIRREKQLSKKAEYETKMKGIIDRMKGGDNG